MASQSLELKAVPRSEEEEKRVLSLVPLLKQEEELPAPGFLFPVTTTDSSVDEMLLGLILETVNHDKYPNLGSSKAFSDSVKRALNQSFEVRMKLIKDWLQVLMVSKEKVLPIFGMDDTTYPDLEKMFLRIISTLPITDSLELLKQCIRLSTLNVEESRHLLSAFNTWLRRAAQPSD